MKIYALLCAILLSNVGFASNQPFDPKCIGCFNFVAPSVVGAENITAPAVGLIVYDNFYNEFRGYKADGTWTKFWSGQNFVHPTDQSILLTSSDDIVIANASFTALTISLPAADLNEGKQFIIKKSPQDTSFNLVTIQPEVGETIDNASSKHLATTGESIILVSDGSDWQIVSRTIPSDWTNYTPTCGWTGAATPTGKWRRVGSDIELDLKVALSGAPTGTTLTFSLPGSGNLTIDTSKLVAGVATEGIGLGDVSISGNHYPAFAKIFNTTSIFLAVYNSAGTYGLAVNVQHNIPSTYANGDYVTARVKIPISGWEG